MAPPAFPIRHHIPRDWPQSLLRKATANYLKLIYLPKDLSMDKCVSVNNHHQSHRDSLRNGKFETRIVSRAENYCSKRLYRIGHSLCHRSNRLDGIKDLRTF